MTTQKASSRRGPKTKANAKATAKAKADQQVAEEEELTPCQLEGSNCHWKIGSPNGPESTGVCKKCGTQRQFKNSFEYSSWYGAKAAGGRGRGRPRKTS